MASTLGSFDTLRSFGRVISRNLNWFHRIRQGCWASTMNLACRDRSVWDDFISDDSVEEFEFFSALIRGEHRSVRFGFC